MGLHEIMNGKYHQGDHPRYSSMEKDIAETTTLNVQIIISKIASHCVALGEYPV